MTFRNDTIVAIATPVGEGAIGVVRLSGTDSVRIAQRIFAGALEDHRLIYGTVIDPESSEAVDEVMTVFMRAPRTYTREDVIEFHGHGGPIPLRRILSLCLREGARQAEPGEFTLRAFLNGRLDLSQAEAVLDIIQSQTDASLRLAVNGLKGRISEPMKQIRDNLIEVLAHLTARIDFPDDDVPSIDVRPRLEESAGRLLSLIQSADTGIVFRQGVRMAIVGQPNVGKSSLLNRLLGEDRAIVTDIPGTTRDTLEETMDLYGIPVVLTDTAGLNEGTGDLVEILGIQRSQLAIQQSDVVLAVLDGSRPVSLSEVRLLDSLAGRQALIAINKTDLQDCDVAVDSELGSVRVSALTGAGILQLCEAIFGLLTSGKVVQTDGPTVTNMRHKDALMRAVGFLNDAISSCEIGTTEDIIAIDVTGAIGAIGEVTGDSVTEDLLDTIFARFCIGK